jgi:hypothetical protein
MIRGTLALLGFGLLTALAPAPAFAKPKNGSVEEARDRFQKGVQLFREGSYDAALAEFRKAYEIAPSYRLLYNIAQVQYERHDYVESIRAFRQYLEEGGDEVPSDRRTQVQSEIERLEGLVARLEVTTNVDGAEIKIDDLPVGTSPLRDPVLVNSGQRRVSASKPGYATVTRNLTVAGGDRTEIGLELTETGGDAGTVPPSYQGSGGQRSNAVQQPPPARTAMWIGVAATSVFAVSSGVFTFLAMNAKEKFDAELDRPTNKEKLDDSRDKMVMYAAVTDGLLIATAVAGGVTLYFALSDDTPSKPESGTRRVPKLAVAPALGGVSFKGTF